MRVEIRDREWREVFTMENIPNIQGWTIRILLNVSKGRFSKTYASSFTVLEGSIVPDYRILEIFRYANRPEVMGEFIHECEMDEMRREGYYRAMSQMSTADDLD